MKPQPVRGRHGLCRHPRARGALLFGLLLLFVALPANAQSPQHPLDPLTWDESWTLLEVLRAAGHIDSETGFSFVTLAPPNKRDVWAWQPGQPMTRAALASIKQGPRAYEAVVDLVANELMSWREVPGVQPSFLDSEFDKAGAIALESAEVRAALERRGFTDLSDVHCEGFPLGYFGEDGTIQVVAATTGIAAVKAVHSETALVAAGSNGSNGHPGGERADAYGRFVEPNVVAVNHDHFFSFRLDLDVDGTTNSMQIDRLQQEQLPEGHPRRSLWVMNSEVAQTESDAMLRLKFERPTLWRVINPAKRNHVGYNTSYHLLTRANALSLMSADDYPQRRAGFIENHLWVTPYQPNERYAAGMYPTLSLPGQGLPDWTSADRPIADTDIVVWYTVGMHHVVRAEDWPVMPTAAHALELRPFDFFDRNPALDLPKKP